MIRSEVCGAVATLTLDTPARRNALTLADMSQLSVELDQIEANPDLRVCVLAATGSVFSAGADLGELEAGQRPDLPLADLSARIEGLRVPTIAALTGHVLGAAVDIVAACDFRVGCPDLKIAIPAAAIGVHYPGASIARIARSLGPQAARRLLLLAETLRSDDAVLQPWFTRFCPHAEVEQEASKLAQSISALAPLAVQGMKRSLVHGDDAAQRITDCFASNDHAAALTARKEKRPATFTGR